MEEQGRRRGFYFHLNYRPNPAERPRSTALRILFRIVILTGGIFLASYLVPGIAVDGLASALKAAVLLGLLNVFIKPALFLFTLPINLLTLGLFTLVINGFLLWFVGHAVPGFHVSGFFTAIAGAIVISVLNILLNRFV